GIALYREPVWFYLVEALRDNVFFALAPLGFILALRRRTRVRIALACAALLLLGYFTLTTHKEVRFVVLMAPLLGLLAASVLDRWRMPWVRAALILIIVAQAGLGGIYYARYDAPLVPSVMATDAILAATPGPVLVANPRPALAIDNQMALLYYPVLDAQRFDDERGRLHRYSALSLNDCDMTCEDDACAAAKQRFLAQVDMLFSTTATVMRDGCAWVSYAR
ncbi:MAG: hypothetical protein AABY13_03620, partial [Nanoarchaeota archaeon]